MKRSKPSKMTPDMEKEILGCIRSGMPVARVAELLDVDESTIRKHCKQHPDFSARYKKALKARERYLLQCIQDGERQWQARAWLLSKLYPDKYGRKVDEIAPVIIPPQPLKIILDTTPNKDDASP